MIKMINMIVPMLIEQVSSVMPEQGQQDDDRQRHAKQPKQCTSSKTHGSPPSLYGVKTCGEDKGSCEKLSAILLLFRLALQHQAERDATDRKQR